MTPRATVGWRAKVSGSFVFLPRGFTGTSTGVMDHILLTVEALKRGGIA